MTTSVMPRYTTDLLSERIDRSLLLLHPLAGLDAHVLGRALGEPAATIVATHWLHRRSTIRSSLARIRVESAERFLRSDPAELPAVSVIGRAAEVVGFRSVDEMDRAFLRLRRRSSFDVLLALRAASFRSAA